jgi:hypothetical protein
MFVLLRFCRPVVNTTVPREASLPNFFLDSDDV